MLKLKILLTLDKTRTAAEGRLRDSVVLDVIIADLFPLTILYRPTLELGNQHRYEKGFW